MDRYLEKHISPQTLTSNVKVNPLFPAQETEDEDGVKVQPSWTLEEYNTQTGANLADYLKVRSKVSGGKPTGDPDP